MKILLIVKTSEDRNLRMWGKSSDGTLLKIPLSILFGTTLFRLLLLLLLSSSSSLSLSTSFDLFAFGSSSTVFPSSCKTKFQMGIRNFVDKRKSISRKREKDKPGRRQKEPRIRGSELSSRLPHLTPPSSPSSSAIPGTGRVHPRNQTPPPQNSYYLKMN